MSKPLSGMQVSDKGTLLEGIFKMRKQIDAILEGYNDWTKCDSNIDPKKFDSLCKTIKSYGYVLSAFQLSKYNSGGISKYINVVPADSHNDMIPYISFVDGKFYTHPRLMTDFDDAGIKSFIKFLNRANDLCVELNKLKFEEFMTADHPT